MTNAIDAVVIDASAAISVLRGEEDAAAVRRVIGRAPPRLIVPEFFWVEVMNILVRRHDYSMDSALQGIAELDDLGLVTVQSSRGVLLGCLALMVEHELSAYDATYLALAQSVNAELLTLDRQLAVAAGDRAVKLGPNEVREARPPYRLQPWITWDGAAQYLEAVRRATLEEARR